MPSEFGFEPRSPKYGVLLVLGLFDTNCEHCGPFLAILGLLEGKGLYGTIKARGV